MERYTSVHSQLTQQWSVTDAGIHSNREKMMIKPTMFSCKNLAENKENILNQIFEAHSIFFADCPGTTKTKCFQYIITIIYHPRSQAPPPQMGWGTRLVTISTISLASYPGSPTLHTITYAFFCAEFKGHVHVNARESRRESLDTRIL